MKQYQILDYQSHGLEDLMNGNGVILHTDISEQYDDNFGFGMGTYPVLVKEDTIIVPKCIYQRLLFVMENKIVHIASFELLFGSKRKIQYIQEFRGFLLIDQFGKIFEISTYINKDGDFKTDVSELLTIPEEHFVEDNKDMICKIIDSIVKGYGGGYSASDGWSKSRNMDKIIGYEKDDEKHLEILSNLRKHMKDSILDMIQEMCEIQKKKDYEVNFLKEKIKLLMIMK
jgi:hypothetical protein